MKKTVLLSLIALGCISSNQVHADNTPSKIEGITIPAELLTDNAMRIEELPEGALSDIEASSNQLPELPEGALDDLLKQETAVQRPTESMKKIGSGEVIPGVPDELIQLLLLGNKEQQSAVPELPEGMLTDIDSTADIPLPAELAKEPDSALPGLPEGILTDILSAAEIPLPAGLAEEPDLTLPELPEELKQAPDQDQLPAPPSLEALPMELLK